MREKQRLIHPVWEKDSPQREERLAFIKLSRIAGLLFLCCFMVILWGMFDSSNLVLMALGYGGLLVTYIWSMLGLQRLSKKLKR